MVTVAYLGLGANIGDPIQQMVDAREALRCLATTQSLRCSSFYRSSPVGYDDQPDFINCVIELQTYCSPIELLDHSQSIEHSLGRRRDAGNQNAPRVIDIDLLIYGDLSIDTKHLTLPHPRMTQRLFVLEPLLELVEIERYRSVLNSADKNTWFEGQTLSRLVVNSGISS